MNKPVIAFSSFILGAAMALLAFSTFQSAMRAQIYSNRSALESDLRKSLDEFHATHSRFPKSLSEITIPWIKTKERREFLFEPFYYEDRGNAYVLWWPRTQ